RRLSAFTYDDSGICRRAHRYANQKQTGGVAGNQEPGFPEVGAQEQACSFSRRPQLIARKCTRDSAHLPDPSFLLHGLAAIKLTQTPDNEIGVTTIAAERRRAAFTDAPGGSGKAAMPRNCQPGDLLAAVPAETVIIPQCPSLDADSTECVIWRP